ncbi:hypothetical protein P4J02_18100, partial [Bacillus anthracis]|uniref:hypothetical protein n=1 Tax=Bacillus anthracis TaxID=1392 RepID=UPI002DD72588|nr:hypothetical protein [Bacillus anthracis]
IGKPYEGKPHVRFDEGKLKQKRDGKATPKEKYNLFQFSTLPCIIVSQFTLLKFKRKYFVRNG